MPSKQMSSEKYYSAFTNVDLHDGYEEKGFNEHEMEEVEDNDSQKTVRSTFLQRNSKAGFILLVVLACCFIATAVPFFINRYGFHLDESMDSQAMGTCRVSGGFQVDCLPEYSTAEVRSIGAKTKCELRNCCWDNRTSSLPCFQRLPSYSHSSRVTQMSPDTLSGNLSSPDFLDPTSSNTHKYYVTGGQVSGHVMVSIGAEEGSSDQAPVDDTMVVRVGCPGHQGNGAAEQCKGEVFTFDIGPANDNGEVESYVRSQFGPIIVSPHLSEVSLYLPGPRVVAHGLEDFIWTGGKQQSLFLYNNESSIHLPTILGLHPNKEWFLVWLDTDFPGELILANGTQERPVLTMRTMGGPLVINILTAPDMATLMMRQRQMMGETMVPPLWTLGYHLCRSSASNKAFFQDISEMSNSKIPYDTDCIDEQLVPTAFDLNTNVNMLPDDGVFEALGDNKKQLVLPLVIQREYDNDVGQSEGCLISNTNECYRGSLLKNSVMYPDPNMPKWIKSKLEALLKLIKEKTDIAGWMVHGTSPRNDATDEDCVTPAYVPRDGDIVSGSVCPTVTMSGGSLVSHHAAYSEAMTSAMVSAVTGDRVYMMHDVLRYGGAAAHGGYLGSSVPASWSGMATSLREVMLAGVFGAGQVWMPVCGTAVANDNEAADTDLLCLRWTQLAAFMPGMRSWHQDRQNSRMPYMLPKQYQEYIRWSLETRYRLLPYLRTLQLLWVDTGLPLVRPMFVHYPQMWSAPWSQFMLGPDLVIAAVTSADQQLVEVSLPTGSWYDFYSGVMHWSASSGDILSVPTKLYQLPVFMRGGSVLVIYQTPHDTDTALSMLDYTAGHLEMRVALECNASPRSDQIQTCEAATSQPYIVNVADQTADPVTIDVTVTSIVQSQGNITITKTGVSDRTVGIVSISGLSLTPSSTFTFPGVTANMCQDDGTTDTPCWSQQQNVVILRTNEKLSISSENVVISWEYVA